MLPWDRLIEAETVYRSSNYNLTYHAVSLKRAVNIYAHVLPGCPIFVAKRRHGDAP